MGVFEVLVVYKGVVLACWLDCLVSCQKAQFGKLIAVGDMHVIGDWSHLVSMEVVVFMHPGQHCHKLLLLDCYCSLLGSEW